MKTADTAQMISQYLKALDLTHEKPGFLFLCELVKRHVSAFAFSSLSCQLGDDLPLDFIALYQRIVVNQRGGYCFEQNALFYEVLKELGYSPKLLLARVMNKQKTHPGLTHRISLVECGGTRYIVDIGFGPQGPRIPVPLLTDTIEDSMHVFRTTQNQSGDYQLQVCIDGDFSSLYQFELAKYGAADCEIGHFYSHQHPNASFVKHLVVSLLLDKETHSLRDLNYRVLSKSNIDDHQITTNDQLKDILVNTFGIKITHTEVDFLFNKLSQKVS